jgi:hypothetical protein
MNRQHAVVQFDLDIVFLHVWKVGFDEVLMLGLLNVDGRRPSRQEA